MNFLLPAALGLFALAVPIILLYLIRQRLRVRFVSTMLFWENLTPKVHNLPLWRKLRRLISLLLQLILLALLVLALARPIRPGQSAVASSVILVLDPGVTMAEASSSGTRWQEALALARHRIDGLGFGDEAAVIVGGNPPRILSPWTGRRRDLDQLVSAVTVGTEVTDIRPALRLAQNLAAGRASATIELISDTVWVAPPEKELLAHVTLEVVGTPVANSGLTLLAARGLPAGGGEFELVAKVEQNTAHPVNGQLTLSRNGRLMDVVQVTVEAGQPWQKSWHGQETAGADFTAVWKPQVAEGFAPDKQAAARLSPVRELKVSLIAEPQPFLELALGSLPLVRTQRAWPAPPAGGAADVSVFYNTVPPGGWSGKNLVLINPPTGGTWGTRVGPVDRPLVSDVDKNAPLMRFVDLAQVQLHNATEFKPPAGTHVYAECFGKPLVFGHWESEPRWLVIAYDLDQSDFVLRTAFPILLANAVAELRPAGGTGTGGVPGPLATRMKSLVPAGTPVAAGVAARVAAGWWTVIPWWWWLAGFALLGLLLEWTLYTRRVTE